MSRSAKVYIKGIYAGLLTEIDREHYSFCYDTDYYNNPQLPAVSLTSRNIPLPIFSLSFLI